MLVSLGRRRGLGDDLDSLFDPGSYLNTQFDLADSNSAGLTTPTWTSSSTAAPPLSAAQTSQGNNSSSWSWGDLAKNFVQGVVQGVTKPTPQTSMLMPSSSSGISTGVIVAGVAALGLVGFLVMRRQSA